MPQTTVRPASAALAREFITGFRWMLLARMLDDKVAALYRAGKIHGGAFLGRGQEALSVSLGMALRRGDVFAPLIRDLAGRLAFGEPLEDSLRTYLGSPQGPMRGRDGNIHRGRPREGLLPMISHLGAMISVVNGALFARRQRGETGAVGAACLGEGGTSTGAFHEAMNQAGIERFPLVVVVANNQYAYSTPNHRQFACADLADRAVGYGFASHHVDGTELGDCLGVLGDAVAAARSGAGPQMVVASLLRLCGHGEHDDAGYVETRHKSSDHGRDCLLVAERRLVAEGWAEPREIESWREEIHARVEAAAGTVQREGSPDPFKEDWCALSTRRLAERAPEE